MIWRSARNPLKRYNKLIPKKDYLIEPFHSSTFGQLALLATSTALGQNQSVNLPPGSRSSTVEGRYKYYLKLSIEGTYFV